MAVIRRSVAALCLAVLLLAGALSAAGQTQPAKLRVLFIGNSYTYFNDLPGLVERLSAAAGQPIEARGVVEAGATLEHHWSVGLALKRIQQGGWDFVVLQEQSGRPVLDKPRMFEYARAFDAEIQKHGGRTVLFLTWPRQSRPELQPQITQAYDQLARELGAEVAPVGSAWQKVLQRNPNMELYLPDGAHPSLAGSYLGACVFLAVFYGEQPAKLLPPIGPLSPEAAQYLQDIAWETIIQRRE
ncbi:MAG TPA: SGNH/GDSL hydrolase family protein [Candidatus Acidoferrales bacterium]|nr:SGNH/GDSL hydrolase family protein [Candidatus Acidoferrales bacterium]